MSADDAGHLRVLRDPLAGGGSVYAARGWEHACGYFPERSAVMLHALRLPGGQDGYQRLMDSGYRRSGSAFYRPVCDGCRACEPLRVPVAAFQPTRSQRRVSRRNGDLRVQTGPLTVDDQRYELYERYQHTRHAGGMSVSRDDFFDYWGESPIESIEMSYWLGPALVGVGLVDVTPQALSSVYFYFDPDHAARSLGVYSVLAEIEECRRRGLAHWYAGYHVAGCRKMEYKADFGPHELLRDGQWRPA